GRVLSPEQKARSGRTIPQVLQCRKHAIVWMHDGSNEPCRLSHRDHRPRAVPAESHGFRQQHLPGRRPDQYDSAIWRERWSEQSVWSSRPIRGEYAVATRGISRILRFSSILRESAVPNLPFLGTLGVSRSVTTPLSADTHMPPRNHCMGAHVVVRA